MIYFIVTTCVANEKDQLRKTQYLKGVTSLLHILSVYDFQASDYKIIVIENNGTNKRTYLDDYIDDVKSSMEIDIVMFRTDNNLLDTKNKGVKELKDVHDCIRSFDILDSDFIVKMTGRYYFDENTSDFIETLKTGADVYDGIIRYGPFFKPPSKSIMNDCVTGLIGMRGAFFKKIVPPNDMDWVEWQYAKTSMTIDPEKVCVMNRMGIFIAPSTNNFFLV